jgi:HlyD family secretion protein
MKKLLIILLAGILLLSCSSSTKEDIRVPGLVDAEIITIKSLVPGTIDSIHFSEGERVEKGQLLIQIDSQKIKNQQLDLKLKTQALEINQSKVKKKQVYVEENLKYLQKQVKRFRRLKASQSIAGDTLETMKLKLLEAQTSRYELLKTLDALMVKKEELANKEEYLGLLARDHRLVAPKEGFILEKFVSPGENVMPGTPLADLMDTTSIYIEAFVEQREMSTLTLGQQVRILVDGNTSEDLFGTITHFGRKAEFSPKYIVSEKERQALLYQLKISPRGNRDIYKMGMPVTLFIHTQTKRSQ